MTMDGARGAAPEDGASNQEAGERRSYRFSVNGERYGIDDPVADGGQLLAEAGFIPADEHILIQILKHGTRSIGLDERIDLRGVGVEAFRAFNSDRIYRYTVDGRGYEWGASEISEGELREIADVGDNHVLILERSATGDLELSEGDVVQLGDAGTERLRTAKGYVVVEYDCEEKRIPRGVYTTEELMQLFGVVSGHLLNVVDANGQFTPLLPGQKIRVKKDMKFVSQVPCGGSS
jgi:hypothetical protein